MGASALRSNPFKNTHTPAKQSIHPRRLTLNGYENNVGDITGQPSFPRASQSATHRITAGSSQPPPRQQQLAGAAAGTASLSYGRCDRQVYLLFTSGAPAGSSEINQLGVA